MTRPEHLIKSAVETLVHDGWTYENAQVAALITLSRVSASTGPKNLQRLIAENREALIAGVVENDFILPDHPLDCDEYIAIPTRLIRDAHGWLQLLDAEERATARELWACLYPGATA